MTNISIEICVLLYAFQKRFWWMLSSLAQQKNLIPHLIIKINTYKDDPYKDLTVKLIKTFDKLLDLKVKEYDCENFGYRTYTRNFDVLEATSDWLLFTDADIVFHPDFFNRLLPSMEDVRNTNKIISVSRYTMEFENALKLVDSLLYENSTIENSYNICHDTYPVTWSVCSVPIGAGFFQLVKTATVQQTTYVENFHVDRSLFSKKGNKFWGDKVFRNKTPGSLFKLRNIPAPIHISHLRHKQKGWTNICR